MHMPKHEAATWFEDEDAEHRAVTQFRRC